MSQSNERGDPLSRMQRGRGGSGGGFRVPGLFFWLGGAAIAVLVAFVMIGNFSTTVDPGNAGVLIRTLGPQAGVDPTPLSSGFHLRGIGERIVQYPAIQRTYTYTREADERGPENEEITFSDNSGLPMTADVQIVLQVDRSVAPALYTRYRLTFDQLFEGPIRNDVRSAVAAETELVNVEQLYSGGRQGVIQRAMQRVQRKWSPQGVVISQLDWIGNIRYPDVIIRAIQAKTQADQEALAAQRRVATAKASADAKIEQARGEAESNRLIAESIRANPEIVTLRAVERWNGQLPTYMGGDGPLPFISADRR